MPQKPPRIPKKRGRPIDLAEPLATLADLLGGIQPLRARLNNIARATINRWSEKIRNGEPLPSLAILAIKQIQAELADELAARSKEQAECPTPSPSPSPTPAPAKPNRQRKAPPTSPTAPSSALPPGEDLASTLIHKTTKTTTVTTVERVTTSKPSPAAKPSRKQFERLYKEALKNLDGNLQPAEVLALVADLSVVDLYNMLLILGQHTRFFFNLYQAETLSPLPNALHLAVYGVAAGVTSMASEIIQGSIPGITPEFTEAAERQAKAFHFRIKQNLLSRVRGQLILPPGTQRGSDQGN